MRRYLGYVIIAGCAGLMVWAVSFGTLPPADFTFCNGDEVKTVDPAISTGQPEGRIIWALFEGLCRWHPETLEPIPGVAERWELSDDKRTYTFFLRREARWSDGTPVTAHDFTYSLRRFLHPATAAEYGKELWYIENAKRFTVREVAVGDPVEVELHEKPDGALPFAPGVLVQGTLLAIDEPEADRPVFTVEVDGRSDRFQRVEAGAAPDGVTACRMITYDFDHVGIRALDERTLEIRLDHPVPYFLQLMGFYPFSPVNRRCVETHGYPAWTRPENLVGNGAYRLEFRRVRDRIRLVKSPTYWNRDEVRLETIDALAVKSATTMLNLYMTGEVDWIPTVPTEVVADLLRRDDFQPAPYLALYYYLVNTERPPLDDPRVRRALAMAVDRREIVEEVTRSGQVPAYSLVPAEISKYLDYTPPEFGRFDPEEARRLLAEAGYPDGSGCPRIEVLYNTSESHKAIAEVIQAQWKRHLGVDVTLSNQEWGAYLTSRRQGRYMVARAGWIGDYVDPNTFLSLFTSDNPQNQSGWSRAEYDRLIQAAQREPDDRRRLELFHAAERIVLDELPMIPIYLYVSQSMVRPYVEGFYRNIQDVHPLWSLGIDEQKREQLRRKEGLR
ncbi:MAG: peptide ABC transporter substrate-binding protein [Thermoguttaceae bacterium]